MNGGWSRRRFSSLLAGFGLGVVSAPRLRGEKPAAFKLGIITDEIAQDLEAAVAFIARYSLSYCELRTLWGKNIMNTPREELDRAKKLIERHALQVSDIGSPLFKYNLPQMPARPEERDTFKADFTDLDTESLLQKSFELARFWGTEKVRIFSYWRVDEPEKAYPHVRKRLARAASIAGRNRVVLVLENEHECNIGTGKELGRILRDVNSPYLRGNWDPGNAAMLREVPYPDGYQAVRGLFDHMHIKDVSEERTSGKLEWAPVGKGIIDWRGQFKALREQNYLGTMSLETHYRRPDGNALESTRESLEGLLKIVNGQ